MTSVLQIRLRHFRRFVLPLLVTFAVLLADRRAVGQGPPEVVTQPFVKFTNGYDCYRIPAIVSTPTGVLLAFAEARVDGCDDVGNIDLVLRRSLDGGREWEPIQRIRGVHDSGGFGNPVPVVDSGSGRITLMHAYNPWTQENGRRVRGTRTLHVLHSDDDGEHWYPGTYAGHLKEADWRWVSIGPGHGLQKRRGAHVGRMIIGAEYTTSAGRSGAQLFYSDDGGLTWMKGAKWEVDQTMPHPGELTIAERSDGTLYVNARSSATCGTTLHRLHAVSADGGLSFTGSFSAVTDLEMPPVFGSLLTLRAAEVGGLGKRMLLSAPARPGAETSDRRMMTIRSSYDEGVTWSTMGTIVKSDWAGYSDLTEMKSCELGLLYETADASPHGSISFTAFTETQLDRAQVELTLPRTSDGSGNFNHAVVHGNAVLGARGSGQALMFDGTDDYLRLINCPASLRAGAGDFTITAWMRYGASTGARPIVWGYGQGPDQPQFWLRAEPENGRIRAAIDTGPQFASVEVGQAFNDNLWHHVVFRRAGAYLLLSVDGQSTVVAPSVSGDISPSGTFTIHVGARPDYRELFHGAMDDVRIYNRALTEAQIDAVRAGATNVSGEQLRLGFTSLW